MKCNNTIGDLNMAKYLDASGVQVLWEKVNEKFVKLSSVVDLRSGLFSDISILTLTQSGALDRYASGDTDERFAWRNASGSVKYTDKFDSIGIGESILVYSSSTDNVGMSDSVVSIVGTEVKSVPTTQSVRTAIDAIDLSNLVTNEDVQPIETAAYGAIQSGTRGTINGTSIENGVDVTIDMSIFKVVETLPTTGIDPNKIYLVPATVGSETEFLEYLYVDGKWNQFGVYKSTIDLSVYMKTADADKKYMPKSGSTSGGGTGASLSISSTGSFNNYGNNGQAFNAVRDVSGSDKYKGKTGSNYPLNAASFGIKDNGTTAFSHKKYDTFNTTTGAYTGARNTAVLVLSGKSGLRYAKNTGMYKRVGVIDSPDVEQRVYSTTQVDDIIRNLNLRIAALQARIEALESD